MPSIIVTGVGGGVGQSVLKALYDTGYRLVGVDAEPLAAGLYAVDSAYTGYYASDSRFIPRLLEIARTEDAAAVFPGHDVELEPIARHADSFREMGTIPVVSSEAVIRLCDDKLATSEFVRASGYPAPRTEELTPATAIQGPVILKPRFGGARSQRTYVVRDNDELSYVRRLVDPDNCVVQEYVEGDEYTCGTVTLDGECVGAIAMRRVLRDGDTYKAFVERHPVIEDAVRSLADKLQPYGACNFQLRIRDNVPYVFEINARCSGTTAARAIAGFNEPRAILDSELMGVKPEFLVEETTILRYWNELPVSNSEVERIRTAGCLEEPGRRL